MAGKIPSKPLRTQRRAGPRNRLVDIVTHRIMFVPLAILSSNMVYSSTNHFERVRFSISNESDDRSILKWRRFLSYYFFLQIFREFNFCTFIFEQFYSRFLYLNDYIYLKICFIQKENNLRMINNRGFF